MKDKGISYKDAGVDVKAGYESVKLMKKYVKETFTKGVISDIGGFGGMFAPEMGSYDEPILVAGTDGVGTKIKIAFMMDKHDTVGQDCVAMCVNDVLCQGAKPLFFLDYIATGKLIPEKVSEIVKGISSGCKKAGAALIGGETAEMPGIYSEGEYDLAGFTVGIVDKKDLINGSNISEGDTLIGIPSSGLHSNGFSLVRKVLFDINNYDIDEYFEELGSTLGEALIVPTKIYINPIYDVIRLFNIKGVSHITGGGFYENIPRMLPDGYGADIDMRDVQIPNIFDFIKNAGNIDIDEMYSTFNMGIGLVMAVDSRDVDNIMEFIKERGEDAHIIGRVIKDKEGIDICHQ